jgi:hypothetical protein
MNANVLCHHFDYSNTTAGFDPEGFRKNGSSVVRLGQDVVFLVHYWFIWDEML